MRYTLTGANVGAVLREHVDPKVTLYTDSYQIYTKPGKEFAAHETVNHGEGEYSRGTVHTNTAEDYFSQLKRSYRYSTRKMKDGERTEQAIRKTAGKRLRYDTPVQ